MKRYSLLLLTCMTLLWSTSSHAAGELGESGGYNSNPHNLSVNSGNAVEAEVIQTTYGKETQICIFCHTPHAATPQSTLWNRLDPMGMGSFPIRANLMIDDDPAIVNVTRYSATYSASSDYPNGSSKLCLSCHDGVTAIGVLASGDTIDMTSATLATRASVVDLTTSHPISFIYNIDVKNHLGASYTLPSADYLDGNSRVQCTSCHQPHQDTMATNSLPFWRDMTTADPDTAYDNVCIQCHTTDYLYSGFDDHNF